MEGYIDELRFYDGMLSVQKINELYNMSVPGRIGALDLGAQQPVSQDYNCTQNPYILNFGVARVSQPISAAGWRCFP